MEKQTYQTHEVAEEIFQIIGYRYSVQRIMQRLQQGVLKGKKKKGFGQPKRIVKREDLLKFIEERQD